MTGAAPVIGSLVVEFTDGTTAEYERVSPRAFAEFLAAPPVGAFYNSVVHGKWG